MFFLDDHIVQNDTVNMKTLTVEVKHRCTALTESRVKPVIGGYAISLFEVDVVLGTLLCAMLNLRLNGKTPNDVDEALQLAFAIDMTTAGSPLEKIKRAFELGDAISFTNWEQEHLKLTIGG